MRRLGLSLTLGLLVPLTALAAPPSERGAGDNRPPPGERRSADADGQRPGGPMRMIAEYRQAVISLDLSPDQRQQVREVFATVPERLRELAEQTQDMDRRERAERFRELMQEINGQVNEHLSVEQQAALQEKVAEIRERRAEERGDATRRGPRADRQPPADTPMPEAAPPQRSPGRAGGKAPGGNRGAMIERFAEAVTSLDGITAEQKAQLEAILAEARQAVDEIRRKALDAGPGADRQTTMREAREVLESTREQVLEVLSAEQRAQLRDKLQPAGGAQRRADGIGRRGDGPPPGRRPNATERPATPAQPPGERPDDGAMMPADTPPAPPATGGETPTTKPAADAAGRSILRPGDPAPPFALPTTAGRQVSLATLKTRPTVLVFGSYSSPAFRDSADDLNRLAKRLDGRANLYIVYTREAHPAGEWDVQRNREAGISVPRHASAAERLAAARQAVKSLNLAPPVLVDTMDDATLSAYGNHPTAAVVIARDGIVLAYFRHFNAHAVRRAVDEAR